MIKTFTIFNPDTGVELGSYPGETPGEALDAMALDAGYLDYLDACQITQTESLVAVSDEMISRVTPQQVVLVLLEQVGRANLGDRINRYFNCTLSRVDSIGDIWTGEPTPGGSHGDWITLEWLINFIEWEAKTYGEDS